MGKIIKFIAYLTSIIFIIGVLYVYNIDFQNRMNIFLTKTLKLQEGDLELIYSINKNSNTLKSNIKINSNLKPTEDYNINEVINVKGEKNKTNDSFNKSKTILMNLFKNGQLEKITYYCKCEFTELKKIKYNENCSYINNGKYVSRSKILEFEHIVPAENFGKSFIEWREGDKKCIDSKGKKFNGRDCASKVNLEYRYMESDLYNLVPAIGSVNAIRSNYQIAEIDGEKLEHGKCDIEFKDNKFEPPEDKKGDIARIYLYMDRTYPGKGIISDKNTKLINAWNKIDPISIDECNRYFILKEIQKNKNVILETDCNKIIKK